MVQRSLCGDGNGSRTTPDPSSKRREVPWCSVRYAAMGMVQCLLSKKEQAAFPLLAEEGSGVMCYIYILRSTLVHGLCTPSTWLLYSEYMALVLGVHGLCTDAEACE